MPMTAWHVSGVNYFEIWRYVKDILDQLLAAMTDFEPLLPWN